MLSDARGGGGRGGLTARAPDNVLQKSVLRCHEPSLSPGHRAGGPNGRSGSGTAARRGVGGRSRGWVSVGATEKLIVKPRASAARGALSHTRAPRLHAAAFCCLERFCQRKTHARSVLSAHGPTGLGPLSSRALSLQGSPRAPFPGQGGVGSRRGAGAVATRLGDERCRTLNHSAKEIQKAISSSKRRRLKPRGLFDVGIK